MNFPEEMNRVPGIYLLTLMQESEENSPGNNFDNLNLKHLKVLVEDKGVFWIHHRHVTLLFLMYLKINFRCSWRGEPWNMEVLKTKLITD